jgi:hypothetical protein
MQQWPHGQKFWQGDCSALFAAERTSMEKGITLYHPRLLILGCVAIFGIVEGIAIDMVWHKMREKHGKRL